MIMSITPPHDLAEPELTSSHPARGTTLISFDQPNPDRNLVYSILDLIRTALPGNIAVDCPTWDALEQFQADGLRI